MTSMKVAFAVADKPEPRAVEGAPRAAGQCSNFWFLCSEGARDLIPLPGASEAQLASLRPSQTTATATAEGSTEIGELAARVAGRLKAQAPTELVKKIDVIIVCTAGIDSPIGISLAGKVKYIFGAPQALPFTLGQIDGCAAHEALRIARAFLHGPERARVVAIVASECWWYPYIRSFGDYAQYGDGAAALLLTADEAAPEFVGVDIVDVAVARHEAQRGPFDLAQTPWYRADEWPQAVSAFLVGFLHKHGLGVADLADIHSPCLDASFIGAVARASGLPLVAGTNGFVSSVDPLLAFAATPTSADGWYLGWSVGLNGEMGASLHRCGEGKR